MTTTISVPAARYPTGYAVTVTGAKVVSRACAPSIILQNLPRGDRGDRAGHAGSVSRDRSGRAARRHRRARRCTRAAITGTVSAVPQACSDRRARRSAPGRAGSRRAPLPRRRRCPRPGAAPAPGPRRRTTPGYDVATPAPITNHATEVTGTLSTISAVSNATAAAPAPNREHRRNAEAVHEVIAAEPSQDHADRERDGCGRRRRRTSRRARR